MTSSSRDTLPWGRTLSPGIFFFLALVIRLGFIVWRGPLVAPDSVQYLALAKNLVSHGIFSLDNSAPFTPSIRRAPLYAGFLALFEWFELSPTVVASVQAVIDAGVAVAVLALGREIGNGAWAGTAAAMYALHPGAVLASGTLLSETISTALLAGSACALVFGLQRDRLVLVALSGGGIGLATLCRPVTLLLPAAVVVLLLFVSGIQRRKTTAAVLLAAAVLVVCPWIIRSSTLAHRFVPVQTFGAINLYVATRTDWDQRNETLLWPRVRAELDEGMARTPGEMADLDRRTLRYAIDNILAQPGRYVVSRAREFPFLFLTSFDKFSGVNESFSSVIARGGLGWFVTKLSLLMVFSLIPILLACGGLPSTRELPVSWISGTFWIYMIIMHAPVWFESRFWWPAVPFVLVSAALGAARAQDALRR